MNTCHRKRFMLRKECFFSTKMVFTRNDFEKFSWTKRVAWNCTTMDKPPTPVSTTLPKSNIIFRMKVIIPRPPTSKGTINHRPNEFARHHILSTSPSGPNKQQPEWLYIRSTPDQTEAHSNLNYFKSAREQPTKPIRCVCVKFISYFFSAAFNPDNRDEQWDENEEGGQLDRKYLVVGNSFARSTMQLNAIPLIQTLVGWFTFERNTFSV